MDLISRVIKKPIRGAAALSIAIVLGACQTTPTTGAGNTSAAAVSASSAAASSPTQPAPAPRQTEPASPSPTAPPKPGKQNLTALPAPTVAPEPEEQVRRLALLLPLSGRGASIGKALSDAAQMALFEAARDDLEVLVFDTQGTTAGAEDAARLAIADGARLILGPLFGASAEAARPIAKAAGVSIVSFSNNQDIAGDGAFVFGFLPGQQVRRIIRFAAEKGHGRVGALAPATGFGELVVASARIAAEQNGVSVVRATYYDPGNSELSDLIRQFADYDSRKSALAAKKSLLAGRTDQISKQALARLSGLDTYGDPPFDSVLLPAGGPELRGIAPLLAYYDVDPARIRLLGTALWDEASGLGAEPSLVGGWYAAASPETRTDFENKFKRAFDRRPPRLASLGYDAMLLAVALTYAESGPDYSVGALTDTNGFAGVDGIFRLLPDGTNQRGLAVLEVERNGVRVIDPAPLSFTDFLY